MHRIVKLAAAILVTLAASAHADDLADGIAAINRRDYPRALRLLVPLAERGNALAQLRVAQLHYHGQGVPENDAAAFGWFMKAARLGNAEAQFQLANMYTYGFGVPRDEPDPDRAAAQWYFVAAQQGHAEAQYLLAIMFLAGKGVVQSGEEAVKWMKRSATAGHEPAKQFLAEQSR